VMHAEGEPDELRQDRRAAAPGLDHFRAARRARGIRFLQQITVDERAFPNRTSHVELILLLLRVPARHDEFTGALVLARLLALGREAPGRNRMTAAGGAAFAAAVRMVDRVHRHAAVMRLLAHPALAAG